MFNELKGGIEGSLFVLFSTNIIIGEMVNERKYHYEIDATDGIVCCKNIFWKRFHDLNLLFFCLI